MYALADWEISDDGWAGEDVLQNGNRLLTGNGYLGRRGVVDEAEASDMPATILAGIYDRHGDLWREPVNSPDPLFIQLTADGVSLKAGDRYTESHEQALNFRYGVYSRRTSWRIPSSSKVLTVRAERFDHMEDVHLLCMRYAIHAETPCNIGFKQGINCDVRNLNGQHLGNFRFFHESHNNRQRVIGVSCSTLEQKIPLAVFSALAPAHGAAADGSGFSNHTVDLDGKTEYSFFLYGAIYSGLDSDNPVEMAKEQVASAAEEGWEQLLQRHQSCWDAIWRTGDVTIEGDEYAQRCLRYSLYQLWITAPRHTAASTGKALSIPARGLSGQTYKGAVFWDTEMFIAPYFLAVQPGLALQFIRYRIQTLPGARRKAAEYGCRGAFFAWESQEAGDDACSDFNVTDVFTGRPVRTWFRDKQIHISADIVYSIKNYIDFTGDLSVLKEGAMELILEAARFYLSYLYYSPERRRYEVLDVIGPDEYHERVNNNAFTNKMVLLTFKAAKDYSNLLNKSDPEFMGDLVKRLGFNDDYAFMETVMENFFMPGTDGRGVIEQFDGYFRLEDCTLDALRLRLKDPREYWGGGNGIASPTQIIKQADVAVMLAIAGGDYSAAVKKANLDYYEPRTEHGSSLSSCMYALLFCETGDSESAYPFFIKSAEIDITGKSKHFAGLVYIGGTHPAANGGAWMTAVKGFCGLSVENGELAIVPRLPSAWEKVTFTVIIRDIEYEISVTKDNYTICKK